MIKSSVKIAVVLLLFVTSCTKDGDDKKPTDTAQENPLTALQVNAVINQTMGDSGNFNWNEASNHVIWSAVQQGQGIVTVGFGNTKGDFDRSKASNNKQIENEILNVIMEHEGKAMNKIAHFSDPDLNLMDVVITKQETIEALRQMKNIRYIEPADYRYSENEAAYQKSAITSSGCGFDAEALDVNDYVNVLPNDAKVPWSFYKHNIPSAWEYTTGGGITIGIIDSGTSPSQSLLGANFNDGYSSGKSIQKFGTYVDSIWPWSTTTDGVNDKCGHGTSMAAMAAGPRNDNGLPVGVAYNANLITYRAAANVVIEGYHEHNGVKKAFVALANNPNVQVISMSMGYIFSVGKIADAVRYANSKGKLIFCAGGTSTSFTNFVGVTFPAWMPETVAVTGVKEGDALQKCSNCHSGSEIDFTFIMQRAGTDNSVPVVSYYDNQSDYIAGSSVATSATAGIAALVWSKHPTWTKDQVLEKLRQSATFYPNKSSEFGYGNIDALKAVQ
jgi:serine protease